MSKLIDAVKKAEQERTQELHEETGWVRRTFDLSPRQAVQTVPSSPSPTPSNGLQGSVNISTGQATVSESWEQAMELVKRQLAEYERRSAHQEAAQVRLKAQLVACEQLMVQMDQERNTLRQRLEEMAKAASTIETEKVVWLRQMEALRECQALSQAVRTAAQEQQANALLVTQISESQQRTAEELTQYQQRGEALHKHLEQLRFRLAQALAFTGTTDSSGTQQVVG